MKFYLLEEDFGGAKIGVIDDSNPAPEGARLFKTEKELKDAEEAYQKVSDKESVKFMDELFEEPTIEDPYVSMTVDEMRKFTTKPENFAKSQELGLDTKKSWAEKRICEAIYKHFNHTN